MASNTNALSALMHSIALLQSANGDKTQMRNIIEKTRESACTSKRITVDEESFTFTNLSRAKQCETEGESKANVYSSKRRQERAQASASLA
eukprot:1898634-Rhodomonas_salina.1